MEITKIPKLTLLILLSTMLVFAGCSTNTQEQEVDSNESQPSRGSPIGQENTSNEDRIEDNEESEVARRESEEIDETQEQIQDALTTLSSTGSYRSPEGINTIQVEIEIDENNIVQSARVILEEGNNKPTSQRYVNLYNEEIEAEVVGKSLDEAVSPAVVNRSSLTAQGFNEALEKLREERQQ
ncbi:MAG: hypothetical protein LAT82_03105 [Nanoarchaeota archaeon]|nr:hypothetical protein [Nanoarchaeota archaeon]